MNEKKKRWLRYQALLKLNEPYEMTYWKNKLNVPHRRLMNLIRHLIEIISGKSVHQHG